MLVLNLIRAIAILFAIGLYHIYTMDFLTWDQGLVIFAIAFFGLTIEAIVEDRIVDLFNQKSPKT